LLRIERALPFPPLVWRIARFLTVGLVGLAVDSGLFWSLHQAGASVEIARALSLAVATLVTWFLNRLFTFAPSGRAPGREFARYVAVALVAQGFNYGLFLTLLRLDAGAHPLLCLVVSAVATAALSFTGQSLIAFRRARGG
jgi:putative flippase GtrA